MRYTRTVLAEFVLMLGIRMATYSGEMTTPEVRTWTTSEARHPEAIMISVAEAIAHVLNECAFWLVETGKSMREREVKIKGSGTS